MFRGTARLTRSVVALTTIGVSFAGAALISAAPAQSATTLTDFGLQGTAYGTLARGEELPATSGKSAFWWIACTRTAGVQASNHIAGANLGDRVEVGAVTSSNRTWEKRSGVHVASTTEVASVTIGDPDGQGGALEGLGSEDQRPRLARQERLPRPDKRDGLLLVATAGTEPIQTNIEELPLVQLPGEKFEVPLPESGEFLTIPGVVTITSDWTNNAETSRHAQANVNGLRLDLEATDAMVIVGRARARINGGVPAGVMSGRAFGSEARLLDGTVTSGQTAVKPLSCQGTGGEWESTSTLGSTIPGVASIWWPRSPRCWAARAATARPWRRHGAPWPM